MKKIKNAALVALTTLTLGSCNQEKVEEILGPKIINTQWENNLKKELVEYKGGYAIIFLKNKEKLYAFDYNKDTIVDTYYWPLGQGSNLEIAKEFGSIEKLSKIEKELLEKK